MLFIRNLSVKAGRKLILSNINLGIGENEVMILFGPNGSGKSTLLRAIMGFSGYSISSGEIIFKNKALKKLSLEERVKQGLGVMFQQPPKIRGVKLGQIAEFLCPDSQKIQGLAKKLGLTQHLARDINVDFSGGEIKRAEIFQLVLQNPDMLLLDEPESGVDLENISLMGKVLREFLSQPGKSALIITHTGYILDYVPAEKGCMMMEGKLWCLGNPKEMFDNIKKKGYEKCKECSIRG